MDTNMELDSKSVNEIKEVHAAFWKNLFNVNLPTIDLLLDEEFRQIATTEAEVFFRKKDMLHFLKQTEEQTIGNIELRNQDLTIESLGDHVLVIDLCDVYVKIENTWNFYSKCRSTFVLHKTENGWKFRLQHTSLPDNRTEEGETIALRKIEQENIDLRDAVKRRTIELERKNRELEIEGAVERVRAQSLAMYKTADLSKVTGELYSQLKNLHIEGFTGVGIYLFDKNGMVSVWDLSSPGSMGHPDSFTFKYDPLTCPTLCEFVPIWQAAKEDYFILEYSKEKLLMVANELEPSYPAMADNFRMAVTSGALEYQWNPFARLSHGVLSFDMMRFPGPEIKTITQKMAAAFDLAYQRFLDLENSETQLREGQIQLALERVRAKTMAMHKSEDLAGLSLELVKQVQALGVATWFCAFNIDDGDPRGSLEWGTSGEAIFPAYRTPREGIFLRYYEAGQHGESLLVNAIGEEECSAHYEYLCTLPIIGDELLKMKAAGIPFPVSQIDNVAFFKYGYLLFISYEPATESHDIFKRFAKVFEQSYTRFLDLQKAEAQTLRAGQDLIIIKEARRKAEETLTELKAAQKQLIQSEKMASLGELTAGIAHEIQNPLNFVNNFSELSNELMDEMKEELKNGDFEEAATIADGITQNLEKISYHGKRAAAIIRGMLQHSQSGAGQKELTDINHLTDEYLKMAYHGLRSKDKSFNACLRTDFDTSIAPLYIIPQDIGRVILNLITNAFYAVNQKSQTVNSGGAIAAYEPIVSIRTSKVTGKVLLEVCDNGDGIPSIIIDKIFQPFFTTKPTGQGTGLGLSLAYDIMKAHDGELMVSCNHGEGAKFTIIFNNV